jgi:hypothetical protein
MACEPMMPEQPLFVYELLIYPIHTFRRAFFQPVVAAGHPFSPKNKRQFATLQKLQPSQN